MDNCVRKFVFFLNLFYVTRTFVLFFHVTRKFVSFFIDVRCKAEYWFGFEKMLMYSEYFLESN